ncbi:adenosylhomocysteine nucleosidase [Microdochium nivale]|nr:adenosylhomocysteine nucleosidase [Microdochium nivale]
MLGEAEQRIISSVQSDYDSISTSATSVSTTPSVPEIGIICALPKELCAVRALFECEETRAPIARDPNAYVYGHLARYSIVAAALDYGVYGNAKASSVATHLHRSFPQLQLCLLVGIGAGIPRLSRAIDIRLGDIVVGVSPDGSPDLIWHGSGKIVDGVLQHSRHTLQGPPKEVKQLISQVESHPDKKRFSLRRHLEKIAKICPGYIHPGVAHDKLDKADIGVKLADAEDNQPQCEALRRKKRLNDLPHVHYGPIATGNEVVKDSKLRDRLGAELNAYCIEMEAGGVANELPCLVIRGICDYADNRKNDDWQNYAAATAAAYAAYFLTERRAKPDTKERTQHRVEIPTEDELPLKLDPNIADSYIRRSYGALTTLEILVVIVVLLSISIALATR